MGPSGYGQRGLSDTQLPRKASFLAYRALVPQTDTGIRDEYSKARELTLLKELGKLAPYLRYKGRPLRRAAVTRTNRLFSKNTALCQHASGCIGSDL